MVRQDPYLWWIGGVILSGTHGFPLWCAGNDYGDGHRNGFIGEIPAWDGFSISIFKGDFSLMGCGCLDTVRCTGSHR